MGTGQRGTCFRFSWLEGILQETEKGLIAEMHLTSLILGVFW